MKHWPVVVICLIAAITCATGEESRLLRSSTFSVKGIKYHFELRSTDLVDVPDWKMGKEEPAITPNQAYLLAKAKLDEMFPELRNPQVFAVNLSRNLDENGNYHALYHIFFTSPDVDNQSQGSMIIVGGISFDVLLNGKLIAPHVDKDQNPQQSAAPLPRDPQTGHSEGTR